MLNFQNFWVQEREIVPTAKSWRKILQGDAKAAGDSDFN
jgi:hypothetical protein